MLGIFFAYLLFSFVMLPTGHAENFVYCHGMGEVRMNGSVLHVYSDDYPQPTTSDTAPTKCELTIHSHFSYLDVIFVEGSFPSTVTIASISQPSDVRTITKPATSMEEIEHFVGTPGVVISATVPAKHDNAHLSINETYAYFWNAFHIILRGYNLVPNCMTDEEGVVELSLFHGYVLTANLWEVAEIANCEWQFSVASANLSLRLDALISTRGEGERSEFSFTLYQHGELLHNLTSPNKWTRVYFEQRDLYTKPLQFVYNAWDWYECVIFLRFIVYETPEVDAQPQCDYELVNGGGENLTVAMGTQIRMPFMPTTTAATTLPMVYLPNQDCRWEIHVPATHQVYFSFYGAYMANDEKFPNDGDFFTIWTDGVPHTENDKYYTANENLTITITTDRAEASGGMSFVLEMMLCDCYAINPREAMVASTTETIVFPGNGNYLTSSIRKMTLCRPLECRWTRFGSVLFDIEYYFSSTGRIEIYENSQLQLNETSWYADGYAGTYDNITLVAVAYVTDIVVLYDFNSFHFTAQMSRTPDFTPWQTRIMSFDATYLLAASAWQPGVAYLKNGTLRTRLFVHYLQVTPTDVLLDSYDFATIDENNRILEPIIDAFLGYSYDYSMNAWTEEPDQLTDFDGLRIAKSPQDSGHRVTDYPLDAPLVRPLCVVYVDTVVRGMFYRTLLGKPLFYRLAARSRTNRPRLGLYSPPSDDLLIGGEIMLTIKPYGCDDIAPLYINRTDLERHTFFPLPWHMIMFSYNASVLLTFTFESEHDTAVHDIDYHEWTTSTYTRVLIQAQFELSFVPFKTERACNVTINSLSLSANASVRIIFNDLLIPVTKSMLGVEMSFPEGGRFDLLVSGLAVEDEFNITLSAQNRDCQFRCPLASNTTHYTASMKERLLGPYQIAWIVGGAWIAFFLLFFVIVIFILSIVFRNPDPIILLSI